jgi:malate synthase
VQNVREVFDGVLGQQPNQLDVIATVGPAAELIDSRIEDAHVTPEGFSNNICVALLYTMAWLRGNGAVAIDNMMEDAATAEIARSQIWQWIHHRCRLSDGSTAAAQRATDLLADLAHNSSPRARSRQRPRPRSSAEPCWRKTFRRS